MRARIACVLSAVVLCTSTVRAAIVWSTLEDYLNVSSPTSQNRSVSNIVTHEGVATLELSTYASGAAVERAYNVEFTDGVNDLTITRDGDLALYALDVADWSFDPPAGISYTDGADLCGLEGDDSCSIWDRELKLTAGSDHATVAPGSTGMLGPYTVFVGANTHLKGCLDNPSPVRKMWIGRK